MNRREEMMVFAVDCIEGNFFKMEEPGRIYLYNDRYIKNILREPPLALEKKRKRKVTQKQDKNHLKSLESIDFMRWEDSCYGKFKVVPITVHDRLHCHRKDLLDEQSRTASLDRELTGEKVKDVTQIFIPIVFDGHWSLVVVCTTRKKICILDSYPGMHTEVATRLIARLQTYLMTKHNIDTGNDIETPEVQPQDNNCDCGFHVLLYIRGFDKMEIFNISTDKVSEFQRELSMSLYYHRLNRAAAGIRIDIDEEVHSSGERVDGNQEKSQQKDEETEGQALAPMVHPVADNQKKSQQKNEEAEDQDADTKDEEPEDPENVFTPLTKKGRRKEEDGS